MFSWTGCHERCKKPTILSLSARRIGSRSRVLSFWRLRGDCQLVSFPIGRIGAVTCQVWFVSLPCSQSPTKNQSICWMFKAKVFREGLQRSLISSSSYFDAFAALALGCFCAPSISASAWNQSSDARPSTLPLCSYSSWAR